MRLVMTAAVFAVLACGAGLQQASAATRAGGAGVGDKNEELVAAVERGDLAAVKKHLAAGASPDATEEEDDTPALVISMRHRGTEIFDTLVAAGADVNQRDTGRDTPLMTAASLGRAHFVRVLLARGARANDTDRGGHTPLMLAAGGRLKRSLPREVLAAIGLDDGELDETFTRMGDEHTEIVTLLIDAGANLDLDAEDCGMTALVISSLFADTEVVKLLLARGADPNVGRWMFRPLRLVTMTTGELEKMLGDDAEGGFKSEEARVFVEWFGRNAAARAEIARLLSAAGARK